MAFANSSQKFVILAINTWAPLKELNGWHGQQYKFGLRFISEGNINLFKEMNKDNLLSTPR